MYLNKIFNQDCIIGMKERIPEKTIDLILCDLPYGITNAEWDKVISFEDLWAEYLRIIKDNGAILLTAQQPFATDLINSCRRYFRYDIIWEKTQKMGYLNANKRPLRGHEIILVFYKKQPIYNPQKYKIENPTIRTRQKKGNRCVLYNTHLDNSIHIDDGTRHPHSVLKISNWNGNLFGAKIKATKHPTQKPVQLFEWLIKTYTNEGDTVLDNCMGSGTTAIACINTNRKYIGFETNNTFYKNSIDRICQHTTQVI